MWDNIKELWEEMPLFRHLSTFVAVSTAVLLVKLI